MSPRCVGVSRVRRVSAACGAARSSWHRARPAKRFADWRAAEIIAAEGSSGRPLGTSLGDRALPAALWLARRARRGTHPPGAAAEEPFARYDARAATADARGECAATGATAAVTGGAPVAPASSALPPRLDATRTETSACASPLRAPLEPPCASVVPSDPFACDARLVEAMRVLRTTEPGIGRLLRVMAEHRFYGTFGYRAFDDYVHARLGISVRKAWALLKLEKATIRSDDFGRAYRECRLSWVRALTLLPVLDRASAAAWVARAESVTVRRLNDEVEWLLTARDVLGPGVGLEPPPVDSRLPWPVRVTPPGPGSSSTATPSEECRDSSPAARLQIRAHGAGTNVGSTDASGAPLGTSLDAVNCHSVSTRRDVLEVCDTEVRFTGPASVVALLRDVLDAFGAAAEPRWMALERLLRHVIVHWESTPRHHDPVFARDGWRCTVPACSSRRNLHDHHIRFRSRGGDNRGDNRTVVCAAHHLHGIHDGTIRASGLAPHAIEWRLGVRTGLPPLLVCLGDRYCPPEAW